ncbi:MAG: Gfo/Idh/MocA family oxidoreductase [Thermoleophilaceae bacterium]|nr:Gfo/Idh/MocA family oxidoreductase [Thermoleophilaceae bacterium]
MGLRLGLLSTARINEQLVGGARLVDEVDVVAVASRDLSRASEQAAALGVERALGSYEELLEDPDVDAVYISLPNSMHVEWSIRALEAGKHVLCEKPLARSVEPVERAFDAASAAGRVLAEGFMWRHHPQADRLVELLPRVGELRVVRAQFSFALDADTLGAAGNIRLSGELEGGALMDVGCYCVSAARLVAGDPVAVTGQQVTGGAGVDVRFTGTLSFPGDVLGHFDCGVDTADRSELEVVGSEGALLLSDPFHAAEPVIDVWPADGSPERVEVERDNPYACELRDFAAAVAGERTPRLGREDAMGQARTIAALYESAASGARVTG